jgi:hypothetical protein
LYAEADIEGFQIGNPEGFSGTPYFMRCKKMHAAARWWQVLMSHFFFIELQEATLEGLEVHIEQSFLTSNMNEIMVNVAKTPFGKWAEEKLLHDKRRKYIVDSIRILDMHVHVIMAGTPIAEVTVPPLVVEGIGVKQHGVVLEALIGELVQALSVSALNVEDDHVRVNILKTMNSLQPRGQEEDGQIQ